MLRQCLHRIELQVKKESLVCTFQWVLAITTFMHNALLVINGTTPTTLCSGGNRNCYLRLEEVTSMNFLTVPLGQLNQSKRNVHNITGIMPS